MYTDKRDFSTDATKNAYRVALLFQIGVESILGHLIHSGVRQRIRSFPAIRVERTP